MGDYRDEWAGLNTVLGSWCHGKLKLRLQQTKITGSRDRFGAPFDFKFAVDIAVMAFCCIHGDEKPLTNLTIGKPICYQPRHF